MDPRFIGGGAGGGLRDGRGRAVVDDALAEGDGAGVALSQLADDGGSMIRVIGGGLAGCEAAWQAASMGVPVALIEMRPNAVIFKGGYSVTTSKGTHRAKIYIGDEPLYGRNAYFTFGLPLSEPSE